MKKLHKFILKSYIGPLIMTFFITVFILLMQFVWKYVSDLVGKGVDNLVLLELLGYAALQTVTLAMPLAILLASLMTFGNLGENYELTAMKAAGISLLRIIKPLVIVTLLLCWASFEFSNKVIPVTNLKLYSLLYSVREANPDLDIQEKIFYNGITNYSIKVEHKDPESGILYDLMIYDHSNTSARNSNVTIADSGIIDVSSNKQSLKLTLFDGVKYNAKADGKKGRIKDRDKQSFRTEYFDKQVALIPLKGLDFKRMDEDRFKSNYKMKNISQLEYSKDSLEKKLDTEISTLEPKVSQSYFIKSKRRMAEARISRLDSNKIISSRDSSYLILPSIDTYTALNVDSLFQTLELNKKITSITNAKRSARDVKMKIDAQADKTKALGRLIRKHEIEWNKKFALAVACLIFFFIGAPLGSIIRKGGLGLPAVICIVFFIIYFVIDTTSIKLAKEGTISPALGAWMSAIILAPIGALLTVKASNDSPIITDNQRKRLNYIFNIIYVPIKYIISIFKKNK